MQLKFRDMVCSAAIVLASLTISSCATVSRIDGEAAPALSSVTLDGIEQALEKGEYERVLQDAQLVAGDLSGASGRVERLRRDAVSGLADKFEGALEAGDYAEAESIGRSLSALETAGVDTGASAGGALEILVKRLERSAGNDAGSPVPLLNRLLLEETAGLGDEALRTAGALAVAEKNGSLAEKLAEEFSARQAEIPEELSSFLETRVKNPQGQLAAVATVWVNRGMTIRGGVGMPDRVIGSGFFIDRRGYLLTNYHVIASEVDPAYEGFSRLYVKFSDDKDTRIPARVIGYSETFDLALLKTEKEPEAVLSFSPEETLNVGERIYAIGSPGGLENTLTAGIISSVGRRFLQLGDVVQVDVPINQGNSGGPLLNEEGELIGVVFAGIEQFEGINFAIPARWALMLLEQLYEGGPYPLAGLGISVRELEEGLEVIYVAPGGPAERTGVRTGDILTAVAGVPVNELTAVHAIMVGRRPGELLATEWRRNGGRSMLLVRTSERETVPFRKFSADDRPENLFPALFGMKVELIGEGIFTDRYQVTEVFPGSVADETGFSPLDPFTLQKWQVLEEPEAVVAQIRVKKRKAGFLESGVQLAAYLETPNFL